ncbi:hypothetical protein [Mesorhizobium sp. CN2-181]|uniref:hypothetical protein n=1 Tax=Mesorhizobium yinganensis TaxID=3157707 RepID=UPI0032B71CA4
MTRITSIPVDVREAMGAILETARGLDRPFGVSEAVDQIRRQFPNMEVSDNDLVGAFVGEAVTADVKMDLAMSTENRLGTPEPSKSLHRQKRGRPGENDNSRLELMQNGEAGIINNNDM